MYSDNPKYYTGILCKEFKNLAFKDCLFIVRYNSTEANSKQINVNNFIGVSALYGNDMLVQNTLCDFRQSLPNGMIVRYVTGTGSKHQLFINDIEIQVPYFVSTTHAITVDGVSTTEYINIHPANGFNHINKEAETPTSPKTIKIRI